MNDLLSNIKIKNIYIQRHAISCANIIEFNFNKEKEVMSKYAPNSQINYLGFHQCLKVSDYLNNFRIDNRNGKKPLLIFCCSELIRTQQTLFLSWLKYLKDYKENNGKILVMPWLSEVFKKHGAKIVDKDNYPSKLDTTKKIWKKFIKNINKNFKQIKADTFNPNSSLIQDIKSIKNSESWDELFYLSPIIYKEKTNDVFFEKGKKNKKNDIKQLNIIIEKYLIDQKIKLENYDCIELILVTHFVISNNLIKYLIPSYDEYFLENCQVIRLPGECLNNHKNKNLKIECIFPKNKNSINLLYLFYISKIDIFIITENLGNLLNNFLYKFSLKEYLNKLINMKKYIKNLEKKYKHNSTFYNYNAIIQKMEEKIKYFENYFQKNENKNYKFKKFDMIFIKNYLFGFCGLNQAKIKSITSS